MSFVSFLVGEAGLNQIVAGGQQIIHGHPILIGREMIHAFLHAPVTATAREVEHQYQQHIKYVPVIDPRLGMNIDTPEDYERLSSVEMISSEKDF